MTKILAFVELTFENADSWYLAQDFEVTEDLSLSKICTWGPKKGMREIRMVSQRRNLTRVCCHAAVQWNFLLRVLGKNANGRLT